MDRSRRWSGIALAVLGVAGSVLAMAVRVQAAAVPVAPLERGRQLARWFCAGTLDSLHASLETRTAQVLTIKRLQEYYDQVSASITVERRLVTETVTSEDTLQVYSRLATYGTNPEALEIQFKLDARGVAHSFFVRQPQRPLPTHSLEYQTKTRLRLPFEGSWLVLWGGRTTAQNRHTIIPEQRFGVDFTIFPEARASAADPKSMAAFPAFGKRVLAPAAGTVVAVVDGLEDNAPGSVVDHAHPLGNYVVIDHGNGEVSWLGHLQKSSVAVAAGRKVKAGQLIGLCGSSGATPMAQLHYHLQTTTDAVTGDGLPAFFSGYVADGKPVERGEPLQGQTISVP